MAQSGPFHILGGLRAPVLLVVIQFLIVEPRLENSELEALMLVIYRLPCGGYLLSVAIVVCFPL